MAKKATAQKSVSLSDSLVEELRNRKPARRMAEVPPDVKEGLELGLLESKNLVEWLCIDRLRLAQHALPSLGLHVELENIEKKHRTQGELKALKFSRWIGEELAASLSPKTPAWLAMSRHTSDVIREWSACVVGYRLDLSFAEKLKTIFPLADDPNPGLRELAWMALRDDVAKDPVSTIDQLVDWTSHASDRIRRYASEITRPCGVWCAHIARLKSEPALGLPILEPLNADDSKYVRDSVANWLNDAGKTAPKFVRDVTKRWSKQSDSPNTALIIKRALRNL